MSGDWKTWNEFFAARGKKNEVKKTPRRTKEETLASCPTEIFPLARRLGSVIVSPVAYENCVKVALRSENPALAMQCILNTGRSITVVESVEIWRVAKSLQQDQVLDIGTVAALFDRGPAKYRKPLPRRGKWAPRQGAKRH